MIAAPIVWPLGSPFGFGPRFAFTFGSGFAFGAAATRVFRVFGVVGVWRSFESLEFTFGDAKIGDLRLQLRDLGADAFD